ncbi:MAG: EFR1 family ferrodoxin [Prevotella sp.]|nr:EFR1 family ferrodoxin [Prevotella sp.]
MIFYFSGTGNTRWAAEKIAQKTGEELIFIPQVTNFDFTLKEGERIGFCFPTHGWQPPRIVRRFIARLHIANAEGHYCFALTTCGDSIGRTMQMLCADLRRAGLPKADSVFSLTMPESYVCLPFMYTDKPEREQEKIYISGKELEIYAEMIRQRITQQVHTTPGIAPWLMSHVVGSYFNGHMVSDRKFTVDADRCIHCGRCQQACPTGDLHFDGQLPTWQHDGSCTSCLACYHHCPQHAINYGSITRKRGQYYFGHKETK